MTKTQQILGASYFCAYIFIIIIEMQKIKYTQLVAKSLNRGHFV
jgi:hypothetical protein